MTKHLAAALLISAALLLVRPSACAESLQPTIPSTPSEPGIFGVGFTNVTDSSARLVFTTSAPMSTAVVIFDHDKVYTRLNQASFDEIHSVDISNLLKGEQYHLTITGVTREGTSVSSEAQVLQPGLRTASSHFWPGLTVFSSSISGESSPDLDLLAQSGVRMVRIEASWSDLFPKRHEINQADLDHLLWQISELKKRNIEPLVVLDYCVPWAKPYTSATMTWRNTAFGPPDRLEDWDYYLRTIVTAVRGSAKYYEIWNEPDAGYFATGSFVERPNVPAPIGRPPFKDNWHYWLGDRFVPIISEVRKVMDELQPGAVLMNGGWNRDYTGERGDLLFERGVAPDLDIYAFHCYSAQPFSFSRWFGSIDGGFRQNIDRIFNKHHVQMPLAVTEWGWPAWSDPQPGKGFVSFEDAQKFFVKSTFYFLGLQRVEILSQFCLGIGPETRDKDPSFFTLVDRDANGKLILRPSFTTFKWLATTFGSRAYRAVPVQVIPSEQVKAYAIRMKDSGDTYLAVWQDGVPDDKGVIAAQPAREIEISMADFPDGNYSIQRLGLDGVVISQSRVNTTPSLHLKTTLPEISSSAESGIYLVKIAAAN